MKTTVHLYDTTLRDGAQAEDVNFSVEDMVRVAKKLDQFGVRYIEGGWPGSNPKDRQFIHTFCSHVMAEFTAFRLEQRSVGIDGYRFRQRSDLQRNVDA